MQTILNISVLEKLPLLKFAIKLSPLKLKNTITNEAIIERPK